MPFVFNFSDNLFSFIKTDVCILSDDYGLKFCLVSIYAQGLAYTMCGVTDIASLRI